MAESQKIRPPSIQRMFAFGTFEFDATLGELRNHGTRIRLAPQCQTLLDVLLSSGGKAVTREEIRDALWPNTFVDYERSLNRTVAKLRLRLNDDAEKPRFIETIPGKGYRFIAPITLPISKDKSVVAAAPLSLPSPRIVGFDERTTIPSAKPKRVKWGRWASGLAITSTLLVYGLTRIHKTVSGSAFTKGTVVIADFENMTGDPVFDDTLKTGLDVSLRQSPFLSVLSEKKVAEALQLMARPADTRLTPEVVRDICQREGSSAYIRSSIATLGSAYVLALTAFDCQSGDTVAKEQVTAQSKETVLLALGKAASGIRRELGESLATVKKFDVPLQNATTKSLDALKAYSAAVAERKDNVAAIRLLERAIEHDPDFAMAYALLGQAYNNNLQSEIGDAYFRKAFELRDHATERERFKLLNKFYSGVTGEMEKAADVAELWQRTYPNEIEPHISLYADYVWLGRFDKALPHAEMMVGMGPGDVGNLECLLEVFLALNRFEDAKTVTSRIRALDPALPHFFTYHAAFALKDDDLVRKELRLINGSDDPQMISLVADTAAFYGHMREHPQKRTLSTVAEPEARLEVVHALWEAECGLTNAARQHAKAALAKSPVPTVKTLAALVLARSGDIVGAEKLHVETQRSYPSESISRVYWGSSVEAALELARQNPSKAVSVLERVSPAELSSDTLLPGASMHPAYLRGLAYLSLGRGPEAAAEFERIITHRGLMANCPLGALARLQLGRAYLLEGDVQKAQSTYREFLDLWKDADAELPILKHASAEYTSLH